MRDGDVYRLKRLRSDTRGPRMPHLVYVHADIRDDHVSWCAFLSFMRAFAKSVEEGDLDGR